MSLGVKGRVPLYGCGAERSSFEGIASLLGLHGGRFDVANVVFGVLIGCFVVDLLFGLKGFEFGITGSGVPIANGLLLRVFVFAH